MVAPSRAIAADALMIVHEPIPVLCRRGVNIKILSQSSDARRTLASFNIRSRSSGCSPNQPFDWRLVGRGHQLVAVLPTMEIVGSLLGDSEDSDCPGKGDTTWSREAVSDKHPTLPFVF